MLSPDEASRRLQPVRRNDFGPSFLAAVSKLPPRLATLARSLRMVDEQGRALDPQPRQDATNACTRALETISAPDRRKLFAVLFPKLAEHVEAGWRLHDRLPYTLGSARRPFRAPGDAAAHALHRLWWLHSLIETLGPYDDADITWVAAWTPYLSGPWSENTLGVLLAATIDAGGKEGEAVFE